MAPPMFQWRDAAPDADSWQIEVSFADGSAALHVSSKGEPMRIGADRSARRFRHQQAARADAGAGGCAYLDSRRRNLGRHRASSVGAPPRSPSRGFADGAAPVSGGSMELQHLERSGGRADLLSRRAADALGDGEGRHQAAGPSAIPLIAWRLRDIAETSSRVVLTDMHTCANCHSFSADGKTMGMDLDGPQNDKGLYALVPVSQANDDSQPGHDLLDLVPDGDRAARSASASCRRSRPMAGMW